MSEKLRVKVLGTKEIIEIDETEPLASASKFKTVSDEVWSKKPKRTQLAFHTVASTLVAHEVRDAINEIVGDIDEKFVISGIGKALDLGKVHGKGRPVILKPKTMDNPTDASVTTFNWDERNTYRQVELDGEIKAVGFLDGRTDYYRELGIILGLGEDAVVTYGMQRMESYQDDTTGLFMNVWHSSFTEAGYEGHQIAHGDVSEQQEMALLDLMQRMISVEGE